MEGASMPYVRTCHFTCFKPYIFTNLRLLWGKNLAHRETTSLYHHYIHVKDRSRGQPCRGESGSTWGGCQGFWSTEHLHRWNILQARRNIRDMRRTRLIELTGMRSSRRRLEYLSRRSRPAIELSPMNHMMVIGILTGSLNSG